MRKCSLCGQSGHDRRSCVNNTSRRRSRREFDPWRDLEWGEHAEAKQIVADNPDGMTLEEVGNVLGITRERVRQIEVIALEKLKTGEGLASYVEIDGETFAVIECERCDEMFLRQGRNIYCDECAPKIRRGRTNVIRTDFIFEQTQTKLAACGIRKTHGVTVIEEKNQDDAAIDLLLSIMNAG